MRVGGINATYLAGRVAIKVAFGEIGDLVQKPLTESISIEKVGCRRDR
jgi:hypothetical protein